MTDSTYQPRGRRVALLLERMDAEPTRIFTSAECAAILDVSLSAVSPLLLYAVMAKRIYKRKVRKFCQWSASPMEGAVVLPPARRKVTHPEQAQPLRAGWITNPDDPRIGKVVDGWRPPVMQCVRGGV